MWFPPVRAEKKGTFCSSAISIVSCVHDDLTEEQQHERGHVASGLPVLAIAWMRKEALRTEYAIRTVEMAESGFGA
jgi:hypothetical protein